MAKRVMKAQSGAGAGVNVGAEAERRRATKIVATIGRNAENEGHLDSLLAAGVDVVRINGAHCRPGDIAAKVALVRAAEARAGRPVGILLDLGGPKIRVGPMPGGAIEYPPGTLLEIVPGSAPGTDKRLSVTYGALLDDVAPGAEIRMDDGRVCLKVERREKHALFARLAAGGRIKTGAGVNFPLSSLSAPALTSKDKRDLAEGLEAGIDFVGLSFVRSAAHVQSLRRLLDRMPEELRPWIVAKIERSEALQDLHAIARATDILMVARGDLGVEIGLASVPRAQREILHVGRTLAVPVIVATQMLETMIENPFPTRAEVTDVAVAVHDGADAVMLSGETAVGKYPVEAVTVMAEIAKKAEMPESGFAPAASRNMGKADFAAVITSLLSELVPLTEAKAVVVYTEFGRTARLVSKEQLFVPIYAFSPREAVRRRLTILRDVVSYLVPKARTVEDMIQSGDDILLKEIHLAGAAIVETSGMTPMEGATNTLRIRRLAAGPRPAPPKRKPKPAGT